MSEVSAGSAGASEKPKISKLKTHIEIDDFGLLSDQQLKQAGMHEISPLEAHYDDM